MEKVERFVEGYPNIKTIETILEKLRTKGYRIYKIVTDCSEDPHFVYIFAEVDRWPEEFYFIIDPPEILAAFVHTSSGLSELDPEDFFSDSE